jgi:hypothetical protein
VGVEEAFQTLRVGGRGGGLTGGGAEAAFVLLLDEGGEKGGEGVAAGAVRRDCEVGVGGGC